MWPEGVSIEYHGWVDLLTKLEILLESPQEKVA